MPNNPCIVLYLEENEKKEIEAVAKSVSLPTGTFVRSEILKVIRKNKGVSQ